MFNGRIYIALYLLLLCSACGGKRGDFTVTDVSRDTIFHIKTNGDNNTSLNLRIIGELDDTCTINTWIQLSGKQIDTTIYHDFYNENFDVHYKAYKASKGNLKIEYYVP